MLTLWSLACIVGLSHGLPQWPGKGGSGSEKWNEGGKAFTQEGTEEMKYNVIEDNQVSQFKYTCQYALRSAVFWEFPT